MSLVTLIIPTYNRPKLLERILNYYNNYHVKFKIIIADSSKPSYKKLNKKVVQSCPKLDILYLDKFSSNLVSHQKFGKMVEYVKTKYCVFCADDDFIVPNGVNDAVKFLEKNSDYATAHGTYVSFFLSKNLFGTNKFLWKFLYPYESLTSTNAASRLASHLTGYYQVLWAVRRTDILKICYREFLKSKADPFLFGEILPDMLMLIYGKMKRINTLHSARQAFSTSYGYWPSLRDAIEEGTYDKEYAKFKRCLVDNLIKNSSLSKEVAQNLIDSNMEIYLKSTLQEHLMGRVNLILKNFPDFLSNMLRTLHVRYLFLKDKRDRIGKIDDPASKYFKDLDIIKQITLKY